MISVHTEKIGVTDSSEKFPFNFKLHAKLRVKITSCFSARILEVISQILNYSSHTDVFSGVSLQSDVQFCKFKVADSIGLGFY